MKIYLSSTLIIIFAIKLFAQANIGTFDKDRDTWVVNTQKIKCEFIEGAMFPTSFQKGNNYYPNFSLLDELITPSGKYYLKEERWAKHKILKNSPEIFQISCQGKFGINKSARYQIYKDSDAIYTYTFYKNSGLVSLSCQIFITGKIPVKYHILHPGWLYQNFDKIIIKNKMIKPLRGKNIAIPSSGAMLQSSIGSVKILQKANFNTSYKRYDKNSNLFQHLSFENHQGELKGTGKITTQINLEFN